MSLPSQSNHRDPPSLALTIRSHLLLLAMAAFLPVLAFGVAAALLLVRHDRETQSNAALDRSRAMMTAIDAEVQGSIAALHAITAFQALDRDDIPAFHAAARRALGTQPAWLDVTLALPSGKPVMNAAVPWGGALPLDEDPASIERAAKTLRPVVGDVITEKSLGTPAIPVRVPVMRNGVASYVLTAMVRPDAFADLIRKQQL